MATFITLANWTDQGVRSFRDTLDRAEAAAGAAQKLGGALRDIYWTLGPHDIVVISDFPDAESYTAWALSLASQGNIRTTTLRAFTRDETRGIIERAG
jgi:uncharacterized protein with GYD domain